MARRDRLKQGSDARERVMDRLAQGPSNTTAPRRIDRLKSEEQRAQETRSLAPELFNPQAQASAAMNFISGPSSSTAAAGPMPTSLPTFQQQIANIGKVTGSNPSSTSRKDWLEQKQQEREEFNKNHHIWGKINELVEPVTRAIDFIQAYTPGVAAFQRGAGEALGVSDVVNRNAAPVTGSPIINAPARFAGNLAGLATVPGPNQLTAPFEAGQAISRSAPVQALTKGNRLASRAIEGAIGGGVSGAAASVAAGNSDVKDVGMNAALGAGLGAAGDAAISLLGKPAQRLISKYRKAAPETAPAADRLALPAPRERGNVNAAQTADVITPEYTFGLPEPSANTLRNQSLASEARNDLKVIDDELRQLQSSYDRAIVEEYEYLKGSMGKGVRPGGVVKNEAGEVTGRYGRQSNNPKWYQEFYAVNNRKPNNKELYALAKERIDNGFQDEQGSVSSWREQNNYDDALQALHGVRDTITSSLREVDPALNITESPIVSSENTFTRKQRLKSKAEEPQLEAISPEPEVEPFQLPTDPSSSSLGISAFGGKVKPYDHLSTDTRSQLVTRADRERLPVSQIAEKAYTRLVDDLHPLNQFDKAVEKETGRALKDSQRSHTLALNTRGSDIIARQILTEGQLDSKGNVIGKSLKEILSKLPKKQHSYVDFEDYLLNKHAITRGERGEKVFRDDLKWTPESGASKVAAYEQRYPEFKVMADEIYQFQQNMVNRWLVDTGLITEEAAEKWFKDNPYYIPNKRFFSELEKGSGGKSFSKKGFGNQKAPVKAYQKGGSQRQIVSPIESMIENVDAFVKAAKRNEVMQRVVTNLKKDPESLDGFLEIVPENQAMSAQSIKEINNTLQQDGVDGLISNLTTDFDAGYRKATQSGLDKDNVVRVMKDGKPIYVKVNDKALLDAVLAMGPQQANWFIQMVGKATQAFKTLTTGANPVFGLTRNILRDIPSAYIASKTTGNPIRFMADLLQAAYSIATDGKLYQEYKNIGGSHSSPIAADRNLLAQSKRQILPKRNPVSGAVPRAYDSLLNVMNAVESAPRLAEYKRVAAGGKPSDRIRGLFEAQDLTVNFKRRGSAMREIDAFFPYFNAAVQGLDKFARMYKQNPAKTITKSVMAVGIPSMVAYAINYDNPAYEKVSRRTKDNFYLFPNPAKPGTFIKIAKPKEIGTVFADIPERLMNHFQKEDPRAFTDFADQIRTTFLVPGVQGAAKSGGITDRLYGVLGDTIAGPVADVAANRNFADSPIVPAYLERLSPELQSDARTSSLSKWIGEKTGTSPKALDYLLRQYTGVLGQLGLPALTPGAGDNPVQSIGSSIASQVTVDPVFSNDIMSQFYDRKSKLDQAKTDSAVTGELPDDYNDHERKYLGKVSDSISEIRKLMRAIEADRTIPAAVKRDQLRKMQEQMNQLAENAITQ